MFPQHPELVSPFVQTKVQYGLRSAKPPCKYVQPQWTEFLSERPAEGCSRRAREYKHLLSQYQERHSQSLRRFEQIRCFQVPESNDECALAFQSCVPAL